jgi:hypothetical protein
MSTLGVAVVIQSTFLSLFPLPLAPLYVTYDAGKYTCRSEGERETEKGYSFKNK